MNIYITALTFICSNSMCSAYNYFQGFLHLSEPCFDVYHHKNCGCNIEEVFIPTHKAPASNKPATKFFLFTGRSKNKAEQLHQCEGRLPPHSTFDPDCSTEIFVHGYSDGVCRTAWMREMKEQLFLKSDCYNVILVDWTWGNLPDIASAAENAKGVGEQIAYVLLEIAAQKNYDTKNFHITANSYGVISASYAGKYMQDPYNRLGRITALDDALSPFLYASNEERLNRKDALFVDAIHTNGAYCFPFNIGDPRPMGHVDMYVNDGVNQYSCYPYAFQSLLKQDIFYGLATLIYPALCFHVQSIQYYKSSIIAGEDNSYLIGVLCDSYEDFKSGKCAKTCEVVGTCAPLGLDLPEYIDTSDTKRRIYYVPTSLTCPYTDHSGFTGLPLKPINEDCLDNY